MLRTYEKLGIPLKERAILQVSRIEHRRRRGFRQRVRRDDFRATLSKAGRDFLPISDAIREHSDLVRQYIGSVVPVGDNYFAALNSAVFTDGSFVFIPKGVRCPMELSTYFRINARNTGQFETHPDHRRGGRARILSRRLHRAVNAMKISCTPPFVELVAMDDATIKYSPYRTGIPATRGPRWNL